MISIIRPTPVPEYRIHNEPSLLELLLSMPRNVKKQQSLSVKGKQRQQDPDPEPDPEPEPAPPIIILGKDQKRDNDPDPDPEPEPAPPVIILAQDAQPKSSEFEPQPAPHPLTSLASSSDTNAKRRSTKYNLRDLSKKTASDPDPDPEPEPEPEPAPPIIILGSKRQASASPAISSSSNSDMGNLTSKVKEQSHGGKLQSSVAKEDKEQMKEPKNYYAHRSKSMRRKAGGNEVSAQGSGGGLQ